MGAATMPPPKKENSGPKPEEKKPPKKRNTAPVQVDADIAEMLVVIAAHDKKNVSEIASPLLRQWVEANYERVNREMAARIAARKAEEDKR